MAEAWRICAGWLIQCGALPTTHKTTWANAQVFDLAQTLRDGVVLCQLLNHLRPGSVDLTRDICLRPQMSQFLCLKNIRTFLQACSDVFKLRGQDLFDPSGLFDVSDFGQVIYTLSKLSQSPLALQRGVPAFVIEFEDDKPETEDIYKNLEDLADENDLADEGDIYDTVEEDEDSIYDDLVSMRSKAQAAEPEKKGKRQYCIEEIVETEKKYVDALYMLINGFKKPMTHQIPPKEMNRIFLNLEDLHNGHNAFNAELTVASQKPGKMSVHRATMPPASISQVFLKHKDIFLLYGYYCSNLIPAQETVGDMLKDPSAKQIIGECEYRAHQNKFKLRDLLSIPMQRCMKYHLLLRELIKHTEKTHKEKPDLEIALDMMQDICLHVNEVKRDHEIMQNNNDIEKSMVNYRGTPVNKLGRLQKDGELKLKSASNSKKNTLTGYALRYCFLFDKVIIVCNKSGKGQDTHEFNCLIDLEKYVVEDNLPKGKSGKWNWCFWLTPVNNNNDDVFHVEVYCKTEDMMLRWVESIRLAKENINPVPGSSHKYLYTTFTKTTYCSVCKKLLRGLFFQGYTCTECNINVHKACLKDDSVLECPKRAREVTGSDVMKGGKPYRGTPLPPGGARPLLIERNDVIVILDKSESLWWQGRNTRTYAVGMFPSECVRENYEPTRPTRPPVPPPQESSPAKHELALTEQSWYVGQMDRNIAIDLIRDKPDSCYLVRESLKEGTLQTHAITIKHDEQVKHIKVLYYRERYGLVDKDSCEFKTLPELVVYYTHNSLSDVFNGLHSTLKIPLRSPSLNPVITVPNGPSKNPNLPSTNGSKFGSPLRSVTPRVPVLTPPVAVVPAPAAEPTTEVMTVGATNSRTRRHTVIGKAHAIFNFPSRESRELPLQKGQIVEIISKAGGTQGWWEGRIGTKVGYFPSTYVEEDEP